MRVFIENHVTLLSYPMVEVTEEFINKALLLKNLPRPSLPKRETFPPFGKGRLGGIL